MKIKEQWSPERFQSAVEDRSLTFVDVSAWLHGRGFHFTGQAIRSWTLEDSPGPKHPATVAVLRKLLPAL